MFKAFRRSTPAESVKKSGVKSWFHAVIHKPTQAKCTCAKAAKGQRKPKQTKPKPCLYPVPVTVPRKYDGERKKSMCVGGVRVPYLPSQVNEWKQIRREFSGYAAIEEEKHTCEYCLCKSDVTHADEDDDDDEY
ncbi:hypothetical protein ACHHYP_06061 [Achlya hypogyna]|uniref:Uncharacterized protein n=1 Tax=Achlya hypogyna TaxID=1202772 RepID=A0A1V9YVN4_ACHHY|nr:hypothetical protein ACHHYP_06061 [Achlya hypogyna]